LVGVEVGIGVKVDVAVAEGSTNGVSVGCKVDVALSVASETITGAGVQVGGNWLIEVAVAVGISTIVIGVGGGKTFKKEVG